MFWALIYAYNTETIKGGTPTTVADFFDTTKFPGKRALRKRPQGAMEWALIADGVPAGRGLQGARHRRGPGARFRQAFDDQEGPRLLRFLVAGALAPQQTAAR